MVYCGFEAELGSYQSPEWSNVPRSKWRNNEIRDMNRVAMQGNCQL